MDIFAITDVVKLTTAAAQYLGFSKLFRNTSPNGVLSISAGFSPVDAIATQISRSRKVPHCLPRQKSCTGKRSATGDSDAEPGFFSGDFAFDGSGGDDGGGRGGDGRKWNFEPEGDGEGDSWNFPFVFYFMNDVIIWIVLSSCMNFVFKRLIEIMTDGIEEPSRRRVR